jgi:tetratricopeptide (TPR) repeat protein
MSRSAVGRGGWSVLVAAIVLGLGHVATAGPREEAREATRQGTVSYNLGAYDEAAHHYEDAYRLVSDPDLLFNIGQAWRQAGRPEKALVAYKAYLRTAAADAPYREQVRRRVSELERALAENHPPPLTPSPDERAEPLLHGSTPAAPLAPAGASHLEVTAGPEPVYKRWYFWGGVGVAVAGAVVTAVLLSSPHRSTTCGTGALDYCFPVRP